MPMTENKNLHSEIAIHKIIRELITAPDLESLLELVVQEASRLSGADIVEYRRYDPIKNILIAEAWSPKNTKINQTWIEMPMGVGVTGKVAETLKSIMVDDVFSEEFENLYKSFFQGMVAELCVPLLDKDDGLMGVLNLESRKKGAFNSHHQHTIEILADSIVIALRNEENNQRLIAITRKQAFDSIFNSFVHKAFGKLGLIDVIVEEILEIIEETWGKIIEFARKCKKEKDYKELAKQCLETVSDFRIIRSKLKRIMHLKKQLVDNLEKLDTVQTDQEDVIEAVDLQAAIFELFDSKEINIPTNIDYDIGNIPKNLPLIQANKRELVESFGYLIENAIQAMMPDEGTLSIRGTAIDRIGNTWVVIEIEDTGKGIPEDILKQIPTPRLSYDKPKSGLGMGLTLADGYIKTLRGKLHIESEVGQGTMAYVQLTAIL